LESDCHRSTIRFSIVVVNITANITGNGEAWV
jgi:hypothetical protein